MKINKTDKVLQIYNDMKNNKIKPNKNTFGKDELKVSEKAIDYQFAMNKLKEIPDIRKEKVEKIKREIVSGNYNVDGQKIAEKMFEGISFDKKI
ncbi:flagellar biosynthesis anti-sigma factor FlgM [Schnuerera sp.]|uniref:flagellar biosynthesis anti-sigma factor FlgM n=1 Tax=Schnuerera sp. TaxID=2794844 RepID=UPI002B841764|nr:flagellar biosynthesis anti-sigma factor FlgM [Schnuerera sp.]HSH37047.1 flagellar biosynthesis anti-sigma factor FlgM [Schnuerera sp.]